MTKPKLFDRLIAGAGVITAVLLVFIVFAISVSAEAEPEATSEAPSVVQSAFFVTNVSGGITYYEGDYFSPSGFQGNIWYLYSDGSTQTVQTNEMTCLSVDPLVPATGTESATVNFFCPLTNTTSGVTVNVVPLVSLKVGGTYKSIYRACEDTFSTEGMQVSLFYKDGTEKAVNTSDCILSVDTSEPLQAGANSIAVSYTLGSHTVETEISIKIRRVSTLFATFNSSSKFYEGQLFSCSQEELTVKALYEGETEASQVFNYDISDTPLSPGADGKSRITVSLDGKSTEFTVDTVPIMSLVAECISPQNLYAGDHFTTIGITVKAMYGDEFRIDITDETEFTYPETIMAGSTVSASWLGREVDLSGVVTIHYGTLTVLKAPAKTAYNSGEEFDPSGMVMVLTYDDGKTVRIPIAECTVSAPSPLSSTDSRAFVSYYGYVGECEYMVYSNRRVDHIEIAAPPTLIKYVSGQSVDISGIRVLVYYVGDSTPEEVTAEGLSSVPEAGTPVTLGMTSLTIRFSLSSTVYYDATQFIEVIGKTPTALAVTTPPATTVYNEGDTFSPAGMVVSLVYNDGTLAPVTGYTVSQSTPFFLLSNGNDTDYKITVSYMGFDADLKVTVNARKIKSLVILSQPTTTVYRVGQVFDTSGLKLVLNYTDSNVSPVLLDSSDYTVSPSGALDESVTRVYFTCRGLSAYVDVEVNLSGTHIETHGQDTDQSSLNPITTLSPDDTSSPVKYEDSSVPDNTQTDSPVTSRIPGSLTETDAPETTHSGNGDNGISPMTIVWIVIISVIIIGIVILVIYYKTHFT